MSRFDHQPSQQQRGIDQRQAILDTIVDYRFLAPHKIAADERRQRAPLRVVQPTGGLNSSALNKGQTPNALRYRLGSALIAAGVRLQGASEIGLDPRLET